MPLCSINGAVINKFFQPELLVAAQSCELNTEPSDKVRNFLTGDGFKRCTAQVKPRIGLKNIQFAGPVKALEIMDISKGEAIHTDIYQFSHG